MDGFHAIPMFSKKKIRILESIRTIQMGSTENIVLVMRVIGSTDLQYERELSITNIIISSFHNRPVHFVQCFMQRIQYILRFSRPQTCAGADSLPSTWFAIAQATFSERVSRGTIAQSVGAFRAAQGAFGARRAEASPTPARGAFHSVNANIPTQTSSWAV